MVTGIHHIGLSVPNLDQAVEFYAKSFGFELAHHFEIPNSEQNRQSLDVANSAAKVAWLRGPQLYLELLEFEVGANKKPSPPAINDTGIGHICLQTKEDDKLFDEVVKLGASRHAKPVETGGGTAAYVRDPFGNVIEIQGAAKLEDNGPNIWFNHTAYIVSDMARMVSFYKALTGGSRNPEKTFGPSGTLDAVTGLQDAVVNSCWISKNNYHLEFLKYLSPSRPRRIATAASDLGFTHSCFEVENVPAKMAKLQALGASFISPPIISGTNSVVFGKDPEGNLFELISFKGAGEAFSLRQLRAGYARSTGAE